MDTFLLVPESLYSPQVLKTYDNFLIVYKPPGMHSAPGIGENLVDWAAARFPEILEINGRKKGEGGLVHRLDYETHGLLLLARNEEFFEKIIEAQNRNELIKEYGALASKCEEKIPGFPPCEKRIPREFISGESPLVLESFFRPYGPGRKEVRPVPPELYAGDFTLKAVCEKRFYRTRLLQIRAEISQNGKDIFRFKALLSRGFRHQIRCHLAWAGYPVLNDPVYARGGIENSGAFLALRAEALSFTDPVSGEERRFALPEIRPEDILA